MMQRSSAWRSFEEDLLVSAGAVPWADWDALGVEFDFKKVAEKLLPFLPDRAVGAEGLFFVGELHGDFQSVIIWLEPEPRRVGLKERSIAREAAARDDGVGGRRRWREIANHPIFSTYRKALRHVDLVCTVQDEQFCARLDSHRGDRHLKFDVDG